MFHGCMFDPDGDQAAADTTRSSTTLDTGLSVNPRTARRLVTASYTSMIAYLPPAIRVDARSRGRRQHFLAALAKNRHELGSDESGATNHYELHVLSPD